MRLGKFARDLGGGLLNPLKGLPGIPIQLQSRNATTPVPRLEQEQDQGRV